MNKMKEKQCFIIKRFCILIVCFVACKIVLKAQVLPINPEYVPTPTASNIAVYGDISMSLNTGKADISVPIFNTNQRGVDFNVSLNYDTSGLLLNQLPGWTGHNWSLLAGGSITRVVKGLPDEFNWKDFDDKEQSYENTSYFKYHSIVPQLRPNYTAGDGFDPSCLNPFYWIAKLIKKVLGDDEPEVEYVDSRFNARDIDGNIVDINADIFTFNFMGKQGQFYLGNDGNWKVLCDENIDIEFDVDDRTNYIYPFVSIQPCKDRNKAENVGSCIFIPKTIKGFTLIDEYGTRYTFGGETNSIEYSIDLSQTNAQKGHAWNAVSWFLTSVEDRFGNNIYRLKYSRGHYIAQLYKGREYTGVEMLNSAVYLRDFCSATLNAPVYLDTIKCCDSTTLVFTHKSAFLDTIASHVIYPSAYCIRKGELVDSFLQSAVQYKSTDDFYYLSKGKLEAQNSPEEECIANISYDYKKTDPLASTDLEILDKIEIKNGAQSYFYNLCYGRKNRIHLDSINLSCNGKKEYGYKFEYNGFDKIPSDYLSNQTDSWGYYSKGNQDNIYKEIIGNYELYDSISSKDILPFVGINPPDLKCSTYGMLTKIIYPTGGYTLLEYELNDAGKYVSFDRKELKSLDEKLSVGGLRIKSVANYIDKSLVGKKTYDYDYETKKSSGMLYNIPNTAFRFNAYIYNSLYACRVKGEITKMSKDPVFSLSNYLCPSVQYSKVTEHNSDGSSTVYDYTSFEQFDDAPFLHSESIGISPYNKYTNRGYLRGKLSSLTKRDADDRVVLEERYNYSNDNDKQLLEGTEICDVRKEVLLRFQNPRTLEKGSWHTYLGSSYYYKCPKIKLMSKVTNHYIWDKSKMFVMTDSICYDYTEYKIYNQDDYKSFVKLKTGETVFRGNDSMSKRYFYELAKDVDEIFPDYYKSEKVHGIDTLCHDVSHMADSISYCFKSKIGNHFFPVTSTYTYYKNELLNEHKILYSCDFPNSTHYLPKYEFVCRRAGYRIVTDTLYRYLSYDSNYNLTEFEDNNGVRNLLFWNKQGQLTDRIKNLSLDYGYVKPKSFHNLQSVDHTNYEYLNGNVVKIATGNNRKQNYIYDGFGRLVISTDGFNRTISTYHYDYMK